MWYDTKITNVNYTRRLYAKFARHTEYGKLCNYVFSMCEVGVPVAFLHSSSQPDFCVNGLCIHTHLIT